jgi:hypothetical protein
VQAQPRDLMKYERGRRHLDALTAADPGKHVTQVGKAGTVELNLVVDVAGDKHAHSTNGTARSHCSNARHGRYGAMTAQIAEMAIGLFVERGYEETTIGDICAVAGISRSSFFRYFQSKEDVLLRQAAAQPLASLFDRAIDVIG